MKKLKVIDWLMIIFIMLVLSFAVVLKNIHKSNEENRTLNGYPM